MITDINITKLLIMLLFMFGERPSKPECIKKIFEDIPIKKWIFFYLVMMKKKDGLPYLIFIFILYETLYIFDRIIK